MTLNDKELKHCTDDELREAWADLGSNDALSDAARDELNRRIAVQTWIALDELSYEINQDLARIQDDIDAINGKT